MLKWGKNELVVSFNLFFRSFFFISRTCRARQSCQKGNWVSHFHDKLISFFLISQARFSFEMKLSHLLCHLSLRLAPTLSARLWTMKNGIKSTPSKDHWHLPTWHGTRMRKFKWKLVHMSKVTSSTSTLLDTRLLFALELVVIIRLGMKAWHLISLSISEHRMTWRRGETILTFYSCQETKQSSSGNDGKKRQKRKTSVLDLQERFCHSWAATVLDSWHCVFPLFLDTSLNFNILVTIPMAVQEGLTGNKKRIFQTRLETRCISVVRADMRECYEINRIAMLVSFHTTSIMWHTNSCTIFSICSFSPPHTCLCKLCS